MKRCNRCSAENKDEYKFCSNCGARLNGSKLAHGSDKNLIEGFKNLNIILKVIIIAVVVFIFLYALMWMGHIFFGLPLDFHTEGDETYHQSQFDSLDINDDGALSFFEVEVLASDIPYDNLSDIFDASDKNDNNVLKGAEFDGYLYRVDKYHKDFEKILQAQKEQAAQQKANSSSSKSNPVFQDEGHEICPVCGGNQFSEFYNWRSGEMNWQCDDCGEIFRSDDEFYEDYWDANGISCILFSLENNLDVI